MLIDHPCSVRACQTPPRLLRASTGCKGWVTPVLFFVSRRLFVVAGNQQGYNQLGHSYDLCVPHVPLATEGLQGLQLALSLLWLQMWSVPLVYKDLQGLQRIWPL